MSELKYYSTGEVVSRYVTLTRKAEPRQVINTAMDGTTYIQTIGSPAVTYEIEAYVRGGGRLLLERAWADTSVMVASVRAGTYYGRITSLKFGERMAQDWYLATLTLSREVELS